MNTALWIIQSLLAAFFLMAGFGKLSSSKQQHIDDGHIKPGASLLPIWILGILELLGSIGIIVPWLTGIVPALTPITAVCFCIVMVAALVVHIQKQQYKFLPLPLVVIALAAVVAYYRFAAVAVS
ncbi:MAG: DoxX family protein [Ferruginibacter sp.]